MDDEMYSYENIAFYCKEICDRLNVKLDDGNPVHFYQVYTFFSIQRQNLTLTDEILQALDQLLKLPCLQDQQKENYVDILFGNYPKLLLIQLIFRVYILGEVIPHLSNSGHKDLFFQEEVIPLIRSYLNEKWGKTIRNWEMYCDKGPSLKDSIHLSCIKYSK